MNAWRTSWPLRRALASFQAATNPTSDYNSKGTQPSCNIHMHSNINVPSWSPPKYLNSITVQTLTTSLVSTNETIAMNQAIQEWQPLLPTQSQQQQPSLSLRIFNLTMDLNWLIRTSHIYSFPPLYSIWNNSLYYFFNWHVIFLLFH